jgi:uncharacterized protein (TIGR02611 family)
MTLGVKLDERDSGVGVLDRIRKNPTGRLILRIAIGTLGTLVVVLGFVLIPFPGPGWAIVILGLAIWSLEFVWAKSLLDFTKRNVRSWTRWIGRQSLPVRAVIAVAGLIFVTAIVWASVRVSFGVDLVAVVRDWVGER